MFQKLFGSFDLKTELTAGMSVFLAMIYIVPLNALILSEAGMPYEAVVTATALITILATATNAIYAKIPIALSIGMGLNAYFTFGLVKGLGMTWQSALGVVFASGIIFILLSLSPFTRIALQRIPIDIRRSITAGIGAFIIAIATGAVIVWVTELSKIPDSFFSMPASIVPIAFELDVKAFTSLAIIPVVIAFLVTDVFDSVGTLTGVDGKVFDDSEKLEDTLKVDALFSSLGALLGLSTVTTFSSLILFV